jgi:ATP-dependent RNA helicase DeaD
MPLTPSAMPQARAHDARRPGGVPRPARRASAYVRFAINWGTRKGATPQRLLAHVCRRGGIAGSQIGVIAMLPHSATFEVDAAVAEPFATRARVPDPREPHLVIARDEGRR